VEKQEVHVRVRRELLAPVSARGDHGTGREISAGGGPKILCDQAARAPDDQVDQVGTSTRDLAAAKPGAVAFEETLQLAGDEGA
jgi:hypothetical protein